MSFKAVLQQLNADKKEYAKGVGTPLLVLAALGMVILPLPPFLLDILFSFNIALALVVLLVTVYTMKPVEFGMFPAVLLIATIMRLALNVASTPVGLVVFLILIIINFVVITKGAGRISEVSARFTLDAMPGKQMAIDADLNAGFISAEQARDRREEVTREADFYGSMDGASKFVKGDAIAGIVILIINIVGGLFVGMIQHDLSFGQAMEVYTLLTIGDGLVAQLPSLLLSIGTAIVVTRQNESLNMGDQFKKQLGNEKSLFIASGILITMGLVPGMPHLAFLSLGALLGYLAYYTQQSKLKVAAAEAEAAANGTAGTGVANKQEQKELGWDDVQQVDVIGLEVGYRLIPLVDQSQGGELLNRIKGVRKKLSQELGFLVPPVHIRDNLELDPNAYRITLMGVSTGEGELKHGDELAINPGQVFGPIKGVETKDPAFGLDAVWIKPDQKDEAQSLGYTVVDSATVVATHISQLLTNSAALLLGHEEVQNLLDMLGKSHPRLVEGLVPDVLPLTVIVKVLQNLLNEGVAIRDMRSIVQTLVEYGPRSQDPDVLTAAVRISLRRLIVQDAVGMSSEIPVITLAPELEQMLHQSLQNAGDEGAGIEPGLAERLQVSLNEAHQNQEMSGEPSILLTSGMLRTVLSRFVKYTIPGLRVMSYQEVPDERQIKIVSSVGQQ